MNNTPSPTKFPELFFGIAGPIGVDMESITSALSECLSDVNYGSTLIKLTDEMTSFKAKIPKNKKYGKFHEYWWKMDYANALREKYKHSDTLARIAIGAIYKYRSNKQNGNGRKTINRMAYIIRQLKHPDEVRLLRKVYGRQFILISAYTPVEVRKNKLLKDIKTSESTSSSDSEIANLADRLIERDSSEVGQSSGQQLRDTFHLADVFVDGADITKMKSGISRFIQAFFGRTDIAPRKDEYGMYAAKSASLRSSDLSRQVGAAIFTMEGDMVTQGCNEVPKAHGGTYWDSETPDNRDIKKGFDPNERQKRELIRDLIERLRKSEFLSKTLIKNKNDSQIVEDLIKKDKNIGDGPLADAWVMDLTEYGRVVHAEMVSLCDAARIGRSVKGCTLFCTTFPCHNCTKHIIACGISRVVYMEPYPKSRAKELHEDEIELESENDSSRVSFVPFLGISPYRYRDVFQKGRRKSKNGSATKWIEGEPQPLVEVEFPSYTAAEAWALRILIGKTVADTAS